MLSLLFAVLPLTTPAAPAEQSDPINPTTHSLNPRFKVEPIEIYIDPSCDGEVAGSQGSSRIDKIKTAISDARRLAAPAEQEYFQDGQWQLAASRYFSMDQSDNTPLEGSPQFVMENLRSVTAIGDPITSFPKSERTIRISCQKGSGPCQKKGSQTRDLPSNNNRFAEAVNDVDSEGKPLYAIRICPWLFDMARDLDDVADEYRTKPREEVTMNNLNSCGAGLLHELLHINLITEHRGPFKDEYSPDDGNMLLDSAERISEVAKNRENKELLMRTPESYKQFVSEIFFTKEFGFRPAVSPDNAPIRNCASNSGNNFYKRHWTHRDNMVDPIEDFCNLVGPYYSSVLGYFREGYFSKKYYEGTPQGMELVVDWEEWAKMSEGHLASDCKSKMYDIIDNCDTDTLYKHAGSYDSLRATGTFYHVHLLANRPESSSVPTAVCDVWYNYPKPFNQVHMKGAGFASGDWGKNQLRPALAGCGGLTDWHFSYGLEDYEGATYEWGARGRIVIGSQQWNCVRRAMIKAGAPDDLGCGGR